MSKYVVSGGTVRVVSEDNLCVEDKLPAGVYSPSKTMTGFVLEKRDKFKLPKSMFGNVKKHGARIINTFNDRPRGLGVLLTGIKGSGKSLLGKYVSLELMKKEIPTIVLPFSNIDMETCDFIATICSPCVIFIDEVDKVDCEAHNFLLSLMDGTSSSKKMFILTANDMYRISHWLLNRPGRIFYHIKHNNLSHEEIQECCEKHLKNKSFIPDVFSTKKEVQDFSFDFLLSLIEESNRYNESPLKFIDIFNASSEEYSYYTAELTRGGRTIKIAERTIHLNVMYDGVSIYPMNELKGYQTDWRPAMIKERRDGKVVYEHGPYKLVLTRIDDPSARFNRLAF